MSNPVGNPNISKYHWKPGQSANPSGRPRHFKGVAKDILEKTGNAIEIVDFFLDVMRDDRRKIDTRMQAATWLADRALGKPLQAVTVESNHKEVRAMFDLTKLSPEQMDKWIELIDAAATEEKKVLDVCGVESKPE